MNIYQLLSLTACLVCYFFAALVFLKGARNSQNRAFSLATALTGTWSAFPFLSALPESDYTALIITRALYLLASFVPTAWFYFMVKLLNDNRDTGKLFFFSCISIFFASISFTPFLIKDVIRFSPNFSLQAGRLYIAFIAFFIIVFANILFRLIVTLRNARGYRKSRLIYVCWAYMIGALSGIIHFISTYTNKEPVPHDIFIIIYPCILTYAILKYRLMDIKLTITRTGIFVGVYTLVLGLPFLLSIFGRKWLMELIGINWWLGPLFLIMVLATVGPFAYIYFQKRAEALLLREQHRYQETLKQAARELARIHNLKRLLSLIVHIVTKAVRISHSAVYLFEEKSQRFILRANRNFRGAALAAIAKENSTVYWLEEQREPLVYEEIGRKAQDSADPVFLELQKDMKSLDANVIVPGFLKNRLLGFLVLGEKRSGDFYNAQDLNTFSVLGNQAALAIENALLYEHMEEEIKQRTAELVGIQKQLIQAEKLATVGTLAGGVAHEINNPLTAILTNVQMLLTPGDKIDSEFDRESLELIEEATKRCRSIVQKLMAYAKKPLETFILREVDLLKAIKSVLSFLGYQLEQANIEIIIDARENEYLVMGNHNELEQVVTNIILNARDAIRQIKKSGVISISLSEMDDWVEMKITDDGCGIPREIISKLFDPFFTTKEVGKGTGLGLSICQSIAEKHKGMLTVDSEPNKGSVFTLRLPKALKEAALKSSV